MSCASKQSEQKIPVKNVDTVILTKANHAQQDMLFALRVASPDILQKIFVRSNKGLRGNPCYVKSHQHQQEQRKSQIL